MTPDRATPSRADDSGQPAKPVQPKRRSGVVIPQRPKWHGNLAAGAIWLFGSALFRTIQVELMDQGNVADNGHAPMIVAVWHNRLAAAIPVWRIWQKRFPGTKVAALISASRDGGLLSRTFSHFHFKPIRGSSSKRGAQALLELKSALDDGFTVGITPDGPRGPKYVVQPGILTLARLTGVRIVPLGISLSRKKALRSWDAFQVPLPFTRCHAVLGEPLPVPGNASPEEMERSRLALEAALRQLNVD